MTKTYKTVSGDMWDSIAYKEMGNEAYTDKLIRSNLKYRHIVIFPAGIVLDIPDVEAEFAAGLPPWKQGAL
ncbi:tail protein X [Enterocloster aldenensis]|uniref:tail protein X n=1 Tax=Enterocloster aldenensis TaxID=358742 RepID=UPI0040264AD9